MYAYPIAIDTYNRSVVTYRHDTSAGQHVVFLADGKTIDAAATAHLHTIVHDDMLEAGVNWVGPVPGKRHSAYQRYLATTNNDASLWRSTPTAKGV